MAAEGLLDGALSGLLPRRLRLGLGMWRPQHDLADQTGRVVIVTGGNSGVGFQVVKWLAAANATVILASHNMPGARKALRDIQRDHPHVTEARVRLIYMDMTSFESISKFVSDFLALRLPLHGLVNAAGEVMGPGGPGADGRLPSHTLVTNYFAPFYLTHLLLQPLTEAAPSRIVNICSALGEYMGTLDWADLKGERFSSSDPLAAYNASKRALSMLSRELAVRCRGTGVDVFAAHPGFAATNLWHKSLRSYPAALLFNVVEEWFAQHPFYGALPAIYAVTEPSLQGRSGLYLGPPLMAPLFLHTRAGDYWQGESRNDKSCQQLYDATVKIVAATIAEPPAAGGGAAAAAPVAA
ncbi:hypothetical protein HYH03_004862 [Edaphochlamys debaryana]|uniref:Uncharacterized protein n=1 Tax=Edaphochlamys debaryana TaxID=47281 RepID=A0A836C305_9CHLO|nr:hypothetical protein HYH03_004862 [Edaphochlamys debaryana]|eukprot:KAG2497278.1 hypothetical protein HYH03_004862 [Edaphochlamys debaryana]